MKITQTSPSTLDLYDNCPYCFYLRSINVKQPYNPNLSFGSGVHKVLELYHKEEYTACDDPDHQPYLDEYMEIYTPEFELCEERFEVPLFDTGVMLTFKIDLVKDGWIIDHKTSSGRWTQEQADNNKQITAYSYAYRLYFGKEEQGLRFNVFNKKVQKNKLQMMDTYRTKDDMYVWEQWVRETIQKIENDEFEPKPGYFHNYSICPMSK